MQHLSSSITFSLLIGTNKLGLRPFGSRKGVRGAADLRRTARWAACAAQPRWHMTGQAWADVASCAFERLVCALSHPLITIAQVCACAVLEQRASCWLCALP